VLMVNLRFWVK